MSDMLLEGKEIHTYYVHSHVLHGVDFHIKKGEGVALMGRNGMGKTTLLKSLLNIVKPRHGRILVKGDDVSSMPTYRLAQRGIAYVPEGRGIFPNLSVRENLLMAAREGVDGQLDWTFDRVMNTFPRLGERINNGGWQLSGGEQQMLTIGRALMTNPDLLILDEATEGLAPLIAQEIWKIVKTVRQTGIACIVIDKNHQAVTEICNRSVILVKGQVVFDDKSEEIKKNPEIIQKYLGV
jgi:branched-chain amino acid transport system ATP-binding protein